MKLFNFRLQHLLRLREQQEEMAKLKLGHATRRCDEIKLEIENIRVQQRETGFSSFDAASLFVRQAYLTRLIRHKDRLEDELELAEQVRQAALVIFFEETKKAEVLRKLKNRRYDEYRLDTQRQEDTNLDDIVLSHRERTASV